MTNKGYELGYTVVGPLIERFLFKLWLLESFWKEKDSTLLFVARGGLRLRYFYDLFLTSRGLITNLKNDDFFISRMAAYKAGLGRHNTYARDQLSEEFAWYPVERAISCLAPSSVWDRWKSSLNLDLQNWFSTQHLNSDILTRILSGEYDPKGILSKYFLGQNSLLIEHLDQIAGSSKYLLLVDTGWGGSIIRTIKELFPERMVMAFFYGRYSYNGKHNGIWFNDIIGLEAEGDVYQWSDLGSAIFENRHLVEGVCEVNWPSVSGYNRSSTGTIVTENGQFADSDRAPTAEEFLALGVKKYLTDSNSGLHASVIHNRAVIAAKRLRRIVIYPNATEARAFSVDTRSADFGKDIDVPVLYDRAPGFHPKSNILNIQNSLWPQAQIAIDFPYISKSIQFLYQIRKFLPQSFIKRLIYRKD